MLYLLCVAAVMLLGFVLAKKSDFSLEVNGKTLFSFRGWAYWTLFTLIWWVFFSIHTAFIALCLATIIVFLKRKRRAPWFILGCVLILIFGSTVGLIITAGLAVLLNLARRGEWRSSK